MLSSDAMFKVMWGVKRECSKLEYSVTFIYWKC